MNGLWSIAMSGPPMPGAAMTTPPQARCLFLPTTPSEIQKFFEMGPYHEEVPKKPRVAHNMITTKENILRFFKAPSHSQKRPCSTPDHPSMARPPAKMSKLELMEKFKLAAQLNGVDWDEMAATSFGSNTI